MDNHSITQQHLVKINRTIVLLKLLNESPKVDNSTKTVLDMAIEELSEVFIHQENVDFAQLATKSTLNNKTSNTIDSTESLRIATIHTQVNDCLLSWEYLKANPQLQEENPPKILF